MRHAQAYWKYVGAYYYLFAVLLLHLAIADVMLWVCIVQGLRAMSRPAEGHEPRYWEMIKARNAVEHNRCGGGGQGSGKRERMQKWARKSLQGALSGSGSGSGVVEPGLA